MARVIDSNIPSQTISNYFPALQIVVIGAILGLLFWLFNMLIGRYSNSILVSGDISSILVATIGLAVMVTMRMPRPIIIVLSSAVTLWGLASWTVGLATAEIIAWDIVLYVLAYALFSWLTRYAKTLPVLAGAILVVLIARIIAGL
jgi:hypothetical protein